MSDIFTTQERERLRRAFSSLHERMPVAPELDEIVTDIAQAQPARRRARPVVTLVLGVLAGAAAVVGVAAMLAGGGGDEPDPVAATVARTDFAAVEAAVAAAVDCMEVRGGQRAVAEFRDDLDEFVFAVSGGSAGSPEIAGGCVATLYAPVSAAWAASEGRSLPTEVPPDVALARRTLLLLAVGEEGGWLCPAGSTTGYRELRAIGDAPESIRYLPARPPRGLELSKVAVGDEGPACGHAPGLVVTAPGIDGPAAAVAVWPDMTRFDDVCPPPNCSAEGAVADVEIGGRPARLRELAGTFELWWSDGSGVPLRALGSGLDRATFERIAAVVASGPGRVEIEPRDLPSGWRIAVEESTPGRWVPGHDWIARYGADTGGIVIEARATAGFHALAAAARNVAAVEVVEVAGVLGAYAADHGVLAVPLDEGVLVQVTAVADPAEASAIVESLEPVAPDDPRLPDLG